MTRPDHARLVPLDPFRDERGWLVHTFDAEELAPAGIDLGVRQCIYQWTARANTLRGLYVQLPPHVEAKLIVPLSGRTFWVVVDLRRDGRFGAWQGFELSADSPRALFVPRGFANGTLSLTDGAALAITADNIYAAASGAGIAWNDPTLAIDWPLAPEARPLVSAAHAAYPDFRTFKATHGGF
ncbi:MAG: dTDP-4-dehydrorhamnose 3,5-epimerase family protein [Pseudomonadota bacterium]